MSAVRMCDVCGQIFKEGEVGSATYNGTVVTEDSRGIARPVQRTMDQCAACTACRVTPKGIEQTAIGGLE